MKDNIINFDSNKKNKNELAEKKEKFRKLADFLYENELTPLDVEEFMFENESNMIVEFYEGMDIKNPEERVYALLDACAEFAMEDGGVIIEKAMNISKDFLVPPSQIIMLASNMLVSNLFEEEMQLGSMLEDMEDMDEETAQKQLDLFMNSDED